MAVHSHITPGPQRVASIAEQMWADFAERRTLRRFERLAVLHDLVAGAAARADANARLEAALREIPPFDAVRGEGL